MQRLNFSNTNIQYILIFSMLILGSILGGYIGFNGFSLLIVGLLSGFLFLFLTITKPWIAISIFFLLIPLENLYVFEGSVTSTLTKLMGVYLVFMVIIDGDLRYIHEVFKNKKVLWILLFGAVAIISLPFSRDVSGSMIQAVRLWLSIILYFVLLMMIRDVKTLNMAIWALIIGGVMSVLSPAVTGLGRREIYYGSTFERFGGLWGDQNEFAALLLVLLPLCISIFFTTKRRVLRILTIILSLVIFAGFILTYSRSGFIAFSVLTILCLFKFIGEKNKAKILAIVVPLVIITFIAVYYTLADNIISRVETLRILQSEETVRSESSIHLRYQYYFNIGPKVFFEHPLLGVGFRGFIYHNPYRQIAHNTFLEVLTGTGIIGLIPFIMILVLTWKELKKIQIYSKINGRQPYLYSYATALQFGLTAYLVVSMFYSLDINKMLWLIIALSAVLHNIMRLDHLATYRHKRSTEKIS